MKHKANEHRHNRSARTFEEHRCGRGAASVRRRRGWWFYDPERALILDAFLEKHIRFAARATSLDAKHVRSVRLPARESHVKNV